MEEKNKKYKSKINEKAVEIYNLDNIDDVINKIQNTLLLKIEELLSQGSDWRFKQVQEYGVYIYKYVPLAASSYIELPSRISNTKA